MDLQSEAGFFRAGGTLPLGALSYIPRRADHDLVEGLLKGEYCYVLNSRQMGKSSLSVRAMTALQEKGVRVAFVDLTKVGGRNLTAEQWYVGMLREISRGIGLGMGLVEYFKQQSDLPPMQRFFGALREVALEAAETPICIMVDEIDATRSLPFSSDEFFAGIRECFNRRVQDPALLRLTFCLIGVATPSDLIRDPLTTPFNIGRRIELRDFTEEEAMPFAAGLGAQGTSRLKRILYWTGGHPYLTQAVCAEAAMNSAEQVDRIVERMFFTAKARETNVNLADVQNRLLSVAPEGISLEEHRSQVLDLYDRVRAGKRTVQDDETNPLVALLKLCGLARVVDGYLWVRNQIYYRVFDKAWVKASLPNAELERQSRAAKSAQIRVGLVASVILVAMSGLAVFGFAKAQEARHEAEAKSSALRLAESEKERANLNAEEAKQQRKQADQQRRLAEQRTTEAVTINTALLRAQMNEAASKHAAIKQSALATKLYRQTAQYAVELKRIVASQSAILNASPNVRGQAALDLAQRSVKSNDPNKMVSAQQACELAFNQLSSNRNREGLGNIALAQAILSNALGQNSKALVYADRALEVARFFDDDTIISEATRIGALVAARNSDFRLAQRWTIRL